MRKDKEIYGLLKVPDSVLNKHLNIEMGILKSENSELIYKIKRLNEKLNNTGALKSTEVLRQQNKKYRKEIKTLKRELRTNKNRIMIDKKDYKEAQNTINEYNKQFALAGVMKRLNLRQAEPSDIVEGKEAFMVNDDQWIELRHITIDEVYNTTDEWKAFCASDGCRYGLEGLYVL